MEEEQEFRKRSGSGRGGEECARKKGRYSAGQGLGRRKEVRRGRESEWEGEEGT